jgi:SAM-dependent methyltransferase
MFGSGEEFDYFSCADCGCLQIARVPADLASFYPRGYYSFHTHPAATNGLKAWLGARRDYLLATGQGVAGRLLNRLRPATPEVISLGGIPARKDMRILDVGCGSGSLLSFLHRARVGRLEGVDPYISADLEVAPGVTVRKLALDQVSGEFDLIMLHHVFEHVKSGLELLMAGRKRLSARGIIFLRFPTPESEVWDRYRENWVGLDAPRHLFLHTRRSLGILAEKAGLNMERCWCDAPAMDFWASELYKRGLSLIDEKGANREPGTYFSKRELKAFARQAERLNAAGRGDMLAVVLRVKQLPQVAA